MLSLKINFSVKYLIILSLGFTDCDEREGLKLKYNIKFYVRI
jgi:hypothetical protein